MKEFLDKNNIQDIDFLHNNAYLCDNSIIVGTRGWDVGVAAHSYPAMDDPDSNDKMIKREILRFELSIKTGINNYGQNKEIIACFHYPPKQEFINILEKYNIKKCIYGHLHGVGATLAVARSNERWISRTKNKIFFSKFWLFRFQIANNKNMKEKIINKVTKPLEEGNIREWAYILGSKKEIIKRNLLAGISRGIGSAIGFTIIGAIIIYFLQGILKLNIPIIGDYLADIFEIVEKNKGTKI